MDNYKEQFSQIYDQYIDKIYRFVYLKVNSQDIAEDIASKVFLKGWQAYNSKIENPRAFLYQIARNTVIDHYRERAKSKIVSMDIVPAIVDSKMNLEEKAMIGSDFEAAKTAIQSLKQDYQDAIIWHYIDGMDVPEIAQIMKKPAGTVRVILHRGLKELRKLIQES